MLWWTRRTSGPTEAPSDIKHGFWGTSVYVASKVGDAVSVYVCVCVYGGGGENAG